MSSEARLPETIQNLPETLDFWARQTPNAPALIIPGQSAVTYAALWSGVREVADALICSGVGRHDRVVLLLPEGPALAVALLGTMSAAIAVPLPASLTAAELRAALHNLHAAVALVSPTIAAASRDCLERSGIPVLELDEDNGSLAVPSWGPAPRSAELSWPHPDDLALVCQTSGTTGRPKRVPRTHGSLVGLGTMHRNQFGIRPEDRVAFVAPLALSLGQTVLLQAVTTGSSLIFPPPGDLGRQWESIAAERPTWLSAAAGYLELLGRYLEGRPTRSELSSLRFVLVTSAATSATIRETVERELGAPVYTRYSSSEAGAIAAVLPPPRRRPSQDPKASPFRKSRSSRRMGLRSAHTSRERSGFVDHESFPGTWTIPRPTRQRCCPTGGFAPVTSAISMRTGSSTLLAASMS